MEKYQVISQEIPHIKFIAAHWFEGGGIVLVYDEIEKRYKCYIRGLNQGGVLPNNIEDDVKYIAQWGNKFPLDAAKALFPYITDISE